MAEFIRGALVKKPAERITNGRAYRRCSRRRGEAAGAVDRPAVARGRGPRALLRRPAQKVEAALAGLAADLYGVPGVQVSRGELAPLSIKPAGKPRA
jgi:hypothetical protein